MLESPAGERTGGARGLLGRCAALTLAADAKITQQEPCAIPPRPQPQPRPLAQLTRPPRSQPQPSQATQPQPSSVAQP